MDENESRAATLKLVGGRLSLDFTNTVSYRNTDRQQDYLESYADLVAWCQHAGFVTDSQGKRLLEESANRPEEASSVLKRAIALREVIYSIFSAISHGNRPEPADLATFNTELSNALARSQVIQTAEGFAWDFTCTEDFLDCLLWPLARDAANLMTSSDVDRVGECAGDDCEWLFFDVSRNRSRQWCAMEDCGNRAKARRHYKRKRSASPAPSRMSDQNG
ncbi:MAG: CGNR zinc finger domain-containing protein [Candidatus Glassbacteria bacterium]